MRHPLFWESHGGVWFWRGMWDLVPLPMAWPVYVTHAEASAYARWKGRRLPTEAEYHRAAFGTPDGEERALPVGRRAARTRRAGTSTSRAGTRCPVGSSPARRERVGRRTISSATAGSGRRTVFAPFPGFEPMASYPEYSADFFDGQHYVMKGASPATARELVRPSFRNWFRANYPYVYAKFRTVELARWRSRRQRRGASGRSRTRIRRGRAPRPRADAEAAAVEVSLQRARLGLFEAICQLPWYRITRAEGRLLARFAAEMVEPLGDPIDADRRARLRQRREARDARRGASQRGGGAAAST